MLKFDFPYKIDHVAFAAKGLTVVPFDIDPIHRGLVEDYGIECIFYEVESGQIEICIPRSSVPASVSLAKFLGGDSIKLHHIAFEANNIEELNLPFMDSPIRGAKPHMRIAFIHPKNTGGVLYEFVDYRG